MAATEPIQGGPYPEPSDPPDGPNQMAAIVTWAAPRAVMRFASTTARDAAITSPVEGMIAITGTGDSQQTWQYRGGAWRRTTIGTPTTYTPTITADTSPSLGSGGTATGRYVEVGELVIVWFEIVFGTGMSAGSGVYYVDPPVVAAAGSGIPTGSGRLLGPSNNMAIVTTRINPSNQKIQLQYPSSFNGPIANVSHSSPWSWASGHRLGGHLIYERA